MTNKEAIIKACVTPDTKKKAAAILKGVGLTTSHYLRLVVEQLVEDHEVHGKMIIIRLPEKDKT